MLGAKGLTVRRKEKRQGFKERRGFTVVELIIIMTVIAILMLLGFRMFKNITSSAKVDNWLDAYNKLVKSAKMYEQDTEYFPTSAQELWKNVNSVPNWNGPYLQPPGGNVNFTSFPVGGDVTANFACTSGTNGKFQVVFSGSGVTPKLANEFVKRVNDNAGTTIATYDSKNNKVVVTALTAQAVSGGAIYCK